MNRFNATIAAALVCAAFGNAALAQDKPAPSRKADKTQVAPTKQEAQQAEPSNENMDANAQRAHDRNTGSTARSSTKAKQPQIAARDVRDWKAIDKNHDNLISPEEMEASLKQAPPSKNMNKP